MKRGVQIATSLGFLTLIFTLSISFCLTPARLFSEQENRALQTAPVIGWQKLFSGDYAREMNAYFADQFPLRDFWVSQKANAELLLGKGENDGILLGKNGQLAKRLHQPFLSDAHTPSDADWFDPTHVRSSIEGLRRVEQSLTVPFHALLAGRTLDIAASSFSYPSTISQHLLRSIERALGENDFFISTVQAMRDAHERGEYVYYRTDHHWTTRGAYRAYCEIMRAFGKEGEILTEEAFQREVVSRSFYGTLWSASGMKFVPPDSIEIWHGTSGDAFEIIADGKPLDGFYQTEHLARKDQYTLFLDGTHDVVTVTKRNGEGRQRLLLLKDSFANCLAPFLAEHFDLILVNLSSVKHDFTNVSSLVEQYDADRVLLVYTIENMITADRLTRLH